MRSLLLVSIIDVTLTNVEVEAVVTLDPDAVLRDVWREMATRIATFLDYRKWPFGQDVDEADLITIANQTPGVATLTTTAFSPSVDVAVDSESLPTLTRLAITDSNTSEVIDAFLTVAF